MIVYVASYLSLDL